MMCKPVILSHNIWGAWAGQLKTLAGDCGHPGGFRNGQGDHALFSMPRGLCYHDMDFLVIADSQNACLRRISLDGGRLIVADLV